MSEEISNFFLCIGAQKAGTGWFWQRFYAHPELFLTPVKEIHYFDYIRGLSDHLDNRRRRARLYKFLGNLWNPSSWSLLPWYRDYMASPIDDDWYANLFRHRAGRRFAGEVTPSYAIIGEDGFRHMRRLSPDMRVLYVMRNPVERAWSQAIHHARAINVDLGKQLPEHALAVMESAPNFMAQGDYTAAITALRRVFNEGQLCFSFYEEVHADRMAAIERWCRFIGIGYRAEWFPQPETRYNENVRIEMLPEVRQQLRERYRSTIAEVRSLIGHVPTSWEREIPSR